MQAEYSGFGGPFTEEKNEMRERIESAGNTEAPAWATLISWGYAVSNSIVDEKETWFADQGDIELMAESPLELLGLAAMRQARGVNWKPRDEEIAEFLRRHYPTD
jgi:hypothetical protein